MLKQEAELDMTFGSFFEIYETDKRKHDGLLQQYLDLGYNRTTAEALNKEFYRYDS